MHCTYYMYMYFKTYLFFHIHVLQNIFIFPHTSTMIHAMFYHLHNIGSIRRCLTEEATSMLIHSLVTSRLDYWIYIYTRAFLINSSIIAASAECSSTDFSNMYRNILLYNIGTEIYRLAFCWSMCWIQIAAHYLHSMHITSVPLWYTSMLREHPWDPKTRWLQTGKIWKIISVPGSTKMD